MLLLIKNTETVILTVSCLFLFVFVYANGDVGVYMIAYVYAGTCVVVVVCDGMYVGVYFDGHVYVGVDMYMYINVYGCEC